MAKIETVNVGDWNDFKSAVLNQLFEGDQFVNGRFIFRGQPSSDWKLESSFDRWFRSLSIKTPKIHALDQMLKIFHQECLDAGDVREEILNNETYLIALGQHHGLPTPLLDWSVSPYIAAFFAYSSFLLNPKDAEFVSVWAIDTRCELWVKSSEWGKFNGVEIVDVPTVGNSRIRNQRGKFTLSRTAFLSLEDYVKDFSGDYTALWHFRLPALDSPSALADLDLMGINYSSIYPDLTGRALNTKLRLIISQR